MPLWGKGFLRCFGVRLAVHGRKLLPAEGLIVAASHHSLLDTFIYPAILDPKSCYVAKSELARIPLFATAFRLLGNVFVERGGDKSSRETLLRHVEALPPGFSVFIHPEGTRGLEGKVRPMKAGIVHLACQTRQAIIPMVCLGGARLWPRGVDLPSRGNVSIYVGAPIVTEGWHADRAEEHLAELAAAMDDLFETASGSSP